MNQASLEDEEPLLRPQKLQVFRSWLYARLAKCTHSNLCDEHITTTSPRATRTPCVFMSLQHHRHQPKSSRTSSNLTCNGGGLDRSERIMSLSWGTRLPPACRPPAARLPPACHPPVTRLPPRPPPRPPVTRLQFPCLIGLCRYPRTSSQRHNRRQCMRLCPLLAHTPSWIAPSAAMTLTFSVARSMHWRIVAAYV